MTDLRAVLRDALISELPYLKPTEVVRAADIAWRKIEAAMEKLSDRINAPLREDGE